MAAFREVLTKHFPNVDEEISDYVSSILEDGVDDFDTGEDLYEAIGMLLQQTDDSKSDQDIKDICNRLYYVMNGDDERSSPDANSGETNGMRKMLDSPVMLSSMASDMNNKADHDHSIWVSKKGSNTTVDKKKLEKAEAKIQKKQGKRTDVPKKENGLLYEMLHKKKGDHDEM